MDITLQEPPILKTLKKPNAKENAFQYHARILQQPLQTRMSGLAPTASRRMLDPPLIVHLRVRSTSTTNPNAKPTEGQLREAATRFICNVVIFHDSEPEQLAFAKVFDDPDEKGFYNNLLGQTCHSCIYTQTEDEDRKLIFVFPDLGIRLQGRYRLLCSVVNIER